MKTKEVVGKSMRKAEVMLRKRSGAPLAEAKGVGRNMLLYTTPGCSDRLTGER